MENSARCIIGAEETPGLSLTAEELAEMDRWGADTSEYRKKHLVDDSGEFEVYEENHDAVRIFRAAHPTRWTYVNGVRVGLDYPGVDVIRKWLGIQPSEELLQKVQFCEIVALSYWNQTREKSH